MADNSVHQIEPELLRPKPRHVTNSYHAGVGGRVALGCLGLFLLPFLVVGPCSLLFAINGTLVMLVGRTVPGRVMERYYQQVTVLCNPLEPRQSVIYRFGSYEILAGEPSDQ